MERETIEAWITRYALTSGIFKVQAEVYSEGGIAYKTEGYWGRQYAHGKEWHRTEAAAIARAEEMRANKLKSIEKQIGKLKALKFEVSQ